MEITTVMVLTADILNPETGELLQSKGSIVTQETLNWLHQAYGIVYVSTCLCMRPTDKITPKTLDYFQAQVNQYFT